ncbi:Hypothetical predicted protein [Podarcis lilfordi]|nr:Hypothetical predicted protein [Podarcis lilfordi]
MVINHQGHHSQLKYNQLREKVSEHIPVYQQDAKQPDVWTTLSGKKDDFLIYDRCGRLVYHLGLPYSFLSFPYVEEAIQITYCESKCGNCSYLTPEIEEICRNISKKPDEKPEEAEPPPSQHDQSPPLGHQGQKPHHRRHGHRQNNRRHQNRGSQAGSEDVVEAASQQPAVEDSPQRKRL